MQDIPKVVFNKKENRELEFEIFTLENLFTRSRKLNQLLEIHHRVEFHHIIFFTEGSGKHYIDFLPYFYNSGSILFISIGQVNTFEVNQETKGFVIIFTEEFLTKNLIHSDILSLYRLYNYHLQSPLIGPEEIKNTRISNIINEIYEEYNENYDFAKEETLRLLLKLLLLKVERIKQTISPPVKNSEWINIFINFRTKVENHFVETRNAKDYANMLHISYKHLNEVCNSIIGNSAKKYIDIFVVLEIKRHIAISDFSVNELSYKLGFHEPTNLVKFFKKHTHQTPAKFKKLLEK